MADGACGGGLHLRDAGLVELQTWKMVWWVGFTYLHHSFVVYV